MNTPVIANEVTQSMHPAVMDCRATLAVTKSLFKVRVRYRTRYGGLAMTGPVDCRASLVLTGQLSHDH